MQMPVTLPLWLLVLILLFAAVTFASHFLFPSVRWFFRKRMERAVSKLNTRLRKPIEPFKLARRHDTIQRLIYDPKVSEAVVRTANVEKVPEAVAFERARKYAREIVPSFSASVYFGFGTRVARWLSNALYDIRLGEVDDSALKVIDGEATVVFVINHRSNMDYVLITHLVSRASTVAYAVGEWARVWPLSWLIRAMGAYFIRRGSKGQLYRAVLSRYVQMASQAGVTQAFFPEGGLSLTGKPQKPKLGIISYIVQGWEPGKRDVVFVPVGLNYDRVPEDKVLVRAATTGERKFRPSVWSVITSTPVVIWRAIRLKFTPFGTVAVGFGDPLVLSRYLDEGGDETIDGIGNELMGRIAEVIPLVPVPLVSRAILSGAETRADILAFVKNDLVVAKSRNVTTPRRSAEQVVEDGLKLLAARKLIASTTSPVPSDSTRPVIEYYAATVEHHFASGA